MRFKFGFTLFIMTCLLGQNPNEWIIPWVANKDDVWASKIIVNNHSNELAQLELEAMRPSGETEKVTGLTIPPQGQLVLPAGETFSELGSGLGYAVIFRSNQSTITGAVEVASLRTASRNSPAAGSAMHKLQATKEIVFPSMPYSENGFAAPVIVNTGESQSEVTFTAHGTQGPHDLTTKRTIPAGLPFAETMDSLFPEITESVFISVTSESPIFGMAFSFNAELEPAMLNATYVPKEENWKGQWEAFTLSGTIGMTIARADSNRLQFCVEIFGINPAGQLPETFCGTTNPYSGKGPINLNFESTFLGDVSIMANRESGVIDGEIINIPQPNIEEINLSGRVEEEVIQLDFKLKFTNDTRIEGSATLNREG